MSQPDGGPAFPVTGFAGVTTADGQKWKQYPEDPAPGMTLRDWFAGKALQGWAAGRNTDAMTSSKPDDVARQCYGYADAMLKQRDQP